MKLIFRVLIFMLAAVLLCQCEREDRIAIPSKAFLNRLIQLGVDTDGNGRISHAEAEAITSLDISNHAIKDLTGIEAFVNLVTLNCTFCYLKFIDVSYNVALQRLFIGANLLTNLDVSNNASLEVLACGGTEISSLDVSNNTKLKELDLSWSYQLTSLDISKNTELINFWCFFTQLTSLDISNNTILASLEISNMPSLYKICVWTTPFPPAGKYFDVYSEGSPNFYFTTDCSK